MCRWICSTQYRGSSRSAVRVRVCECNAAGTTTTHKIKCEPIEKWHHRMPPNHSILNGGGEGGLCEPQHTFRFLLNEASLRHSFRLSCKRFEFYSERYLRWRHSLPNISHRLQAEMKMLWKQCWRQKRTGKKKLRPFDFVRVNHVTTVKRGLKMDT